MSDEKKTRPHDGKPVPVELWGRDHITTFLYIESCCVDQGGVPGAAQMRTWSGRPRRGRMDARIPSSIGPDHPTRLNDGTNLTEHDDWDCADDMVAAGLLEWQGTGLNPIFKLTDTGWAVAGKLRRARAERTKEVSLQEMFVPAKVG